MICTLEVILMIDNDTIILIELLIQKGARREDIEHLVDLALYNQRDPMYFVNEAIEEYSQNYFENIPTVLK